MWSKVLVIGIIALFVVLVMSIMNIASLADDTSEKWLEEHEKEGDMK